MKKLFLFFLSNWMLHFAYCQYWQQQVNYVIDVSLNVNEKTLDGFEKITYINNSPDTLTFIWFHLWPNAYKNDQTAFSEQMLENGSTKFYFSDKEQRGYINRLEFKVNGITAKLQDHPQHIDIIKLVLPSPLPPKQRISITTPFHVKLPYNFSRGGFDRDAFHITQWYPKPAVYDALGWHPMPYLHLGEFYSEFGDYDVRITVPKDYVVAATGKLQNLDEVQWIKMKSSEPQVQSSKIKTKKTVARTKSKSASQKIKTPISNLKSQTLNTQTKTLQYKQDNIHDFAWFANKNFIVENDTCRLTSSKVVEVFSYYTAEQKNLWTKAVGFAKDALRTRSNWIGDYPYDVLSVIQGAGDFSGGMEYPTITAVSPIQNPKLLDEVIAHEIGHNWFYAAIATNEREHPWMDEGLNSYYDIRYHQWKYGKEGTINIGKSSVGYNEVQRLLLETHALQKTDQAIATSSEEFTDLNYGLVAYYKTAQWLSLLEKQLGTEVFDEAMQTYYSLWKFKHPYPQNFKEVIEEVSGKDLSTTFQLTKKKGLLMEEQKPAIKFATPLKFSSITGYIQDPSKNLIVFSPVAGFNTYDKIMFGPLITNYKLPHNKLQFLLAPLYAAGSKSITGFGKLSYTFYPEKLFRTAKVFVNGSTFSMNEYVDEAGHKTITKFEKIAPGVKLVFKENHPRSTVKKTLQWKTFLLKEENFQFSFDTIISGVDTSILQVVTTPQQRSTIHQLQLMYENNRALYPFSFQLQVEQAKNFVRPTFTAEYFFNYARGGGLNVRLFGGKFIYTNGKTASRQFELQRYHLNMTGAKGYEDYTYSNYFIGRNKFEDFVSQQIMIRDGAFKVRTDLLASEIGKTDNWLIAGNFNTTIPNKINPLSVLPVKIPLRIFIDIGTYAEAWKQNAENDRFLFGAGFHIPLLDEAVNVYIPVIYSKVYGDYYKSTFEKNRLIKTISFTIDLDKPINRITKQLHL